MGNSISPCFFNFRQVEYNRPSRNPFSFQGLVCQLLKCMKCVALISGLIILVDAKSALGMGTGHML